MITEAEAKTKVCPLTFTTPKSDGPWPCIGSACMAWRWIGGDGGSYRNRHCPHYDGVPLKRGSQEPERPQHIPTSWEWQPGAPDDYESPDPRWIEPQAAADTRRKGYCGAFGKPE